MTRLLHMLLVLLLVIQPVASAVAASDVVAHGGAAEVHCPHCDDGCPGCGDAHEERGEGCGAAGCQGTGCGTVAPVFPMLPAPTFLMPAAGRQVAWTTATGNPPVGQPDPLLRPPNRF